MSWFDQKVTVYDQGRDDYRESGMELSDNPYPVNSKDWNDWRQGWLYEKENLELEGNMIV